MTPNGTAAFPLVLQLAFAGALGTLARFGTSLLVSRLWPAAHWLSTLAVNLLGSFLIGVFHAKSALPENLRLMITVGFLGGFTTFSSFSLDALRLRASHSDLAAAGYILLSVVAGIFAAACGAKFR